MTYVESPTPPRYRADYEWWSGAWGTAVAAETLAELRQRCWLWAAGQKYLKRLTIIESVKKPRGMLYSILGHAVPRYRLADGTVTDLPVVLDWEGV